MDVEVDEATLLLAPDEQIEVFRIVQEGLANVRKHASARRAEVWIGQRQGRRIVRIRDDGTGFDGEEAAAGQGLKNMRRRAASIDGGLLALLAARPRDGRRGPSPRLAAGDLAVQAGLREQARPQSVTRVVIE